MVERNRYTTFIECAACGAVGRLHLSEDDKPYIRKLSRRIDKIEGAFEAEMEGSVQIRVTCKSCRKIFLS